MNYLALEGLLIERLEALNLAPTVMAVPDFIAVQDGEMRLPGIIVAYDGDRVDTVDERLHQAARIEKAKNQGVVQQWAIAVVVRNVNDIRSGAKAREQAGLIMSQIIGSLAGWTPDEFLWHPLTRANAVPPQYINGRLFFTLGFDAKMIITPDKLAGLPAV